MKKLHALIVLALSLFLTLGAKASGIHYKVITAIGYGTTKPEAVLNAIEEAIKKEYGFFLIAEKSLEDIAIDTNDLSYLKSTFKSKVREKFKGVVNKYSVVYIRPSDGLYEAKVKVFVLKYTPPGISINSRRRIAVYPFKAPSSELSKKLTQFIEDYITQTRKFSVLERNGGLEYYYKEKGIITSEDANPAERLKLKKLAGTDYLLIGEVNNFEVKKQEQGSKFLGITEPGYLINYSISYKVLMFATGQVKYSNTQEGRFFFRTENRKLAEEKALSRVAKKIVNDLLLDIYPPVVIAVQNGLAVVNLGNKAIEEGACYEAFKRGEKLIDPYTGEFLGYNEIKTGVLKIVDVKPKFSEAKVVSGYVIKGSILRPCKH